MRSSKIKEILTRLNIDELNEMQQAAYAAISKSKSVLLQSPTGSGKTLAFLLPVFETLKESVQGIQCMVLVPSRELALQIADVWKKMSTGFKVSTFYGGHDIETEINTLSEPPALLIGTPGRLSDHIERGSFDTDTITTLVLDEFDKSLSLGFEEEMSFIIGKLSRIRKTILISATSAIEIPAFTGIKDPEIVSFGESAELDSLSLKTVISDEKDKVNTLFRLLCYIGAEQAIVFCNHREAAERAAKQIAERGIENVFFHGGLEQVEREQTLSRFRNGSVYFMVATDLAARGLDIPEVRHVIHYHLPGTGEEFIHRNGRTARMNATGTAWLLLHKDETIPEYIATEPEQVELPSGGNLPSTPKWTTVYISGGKKDKISKGDIAGFFSKIGQLEKGDLGMIEVKDNMSFAAVKRPRVKELLSLVRDQKMKGKKFRIAIAK